jgi:transposase
VPPASIEVAARERGRTAERDSAKSAEQSAAGRLHGSRVPMADEGQRRLRTRGREQLLRHRTRLQNPLRMRLRHWGLLAPTGRRRLCRERVTEVLQQATLAPELRGLVGTSSPLGQGSDEELRHWGTKLREQASPDPLEPGYRSVPGIGPLAARALAGEGGDMRPFPKERALSSFTGRPPSQASSGDTRRSGPSSHQGAGRLRCGSSEAAWGALRQAPD